MDGKITAHSFLYNKTVVSFFNTYLTINTLVYYLSISSTFCTMRFAAEKQFAHFLTLR